MLRWWRLAIVTALIVGYGPTSGQTVTSGAQRPTFRGAVDVVAVNVTVTEGVRRYVTDLGPEDFLIFEDGRQQELTFFQKTGVPLALTLLLDPSASMDQSLLMAQEAASGFVRALAAADVAVAHRFRQPRASPARFYHRPDRPRAGDW